MESFGIGIVNKLKKMMNKKTFI